MARAGTMTGLALAGIVLVGAALRFTGLADQSLWADETYTVDVLGGAGDFWGVPDQVRASEAAPPPYYLLAWVWVRVFGDGDAGLHSLSALFGTATIPVVYLAVRELATRRAALIAAALTACSPILVWYS
jgi:mannosyltransferase